MNNLLFDNEIQYQYYLTSTLLEKVLQQNFQQHGMLYE